MTRQSGAALRSHQLDAVQWPPDPATARNAALTVCDMAADVDEARRVLETLGIREVL